MAIAEKRQSVSVPSALAWIERQTDDKVYYGKGHKYLERALFPAMLAVFEARYRDGLSWPKAAQKASDHVSLRTTRNRAIKLAECVEWMTQGRISDTFVPPPSYAKTMAGELLQEKLGKAVDEIIANPDRRSQIMAKLNKEQAADGEEDLPFWALVGPVEKRVDIRMRLRVGDGIGAQYGVRSSVRTISQDLLMMSVGRVPPDMRQIYRIGVSTMHRMKKNAFLLHNLKVLRRLLHIPRYRGLASLAILRHHGVDALPKAIFFRLFSARQRNVIHSKHPHSSRMDEWAGDYPRRLWRLLGGFTGLEAALPAGMRSRQTAKTLYLSIRDYLEELEVNDNGKPIGHGVVLFDAIREPEIRQKKVCNQCKENKLLTQYSHRSPKMRHGICRKCRSLTRMVERARQHPEKITPEVKRKLRLYRAAQRAGKKHNVNFGLRKPRVQVKDVPPSPLEEFVMVINPEQAKFEAADRRAEKLIQRATGGSPARDLDHFIRSLQ